MINMIQNLNNINMSMMRSQERISSGKRINSAADDPAGLGFCDRLTAQINGMNQAYMNASKGVAELQMRDAKLSSAVDILQQVREKVVALGDGSLTSTDKTALKAEITELGEDYAKLVADKNFAEITFQIGANSDDTMTVSAVEISSTAAHAGTVFTGSTTTDLVDAAITAIDDSRATYGAGINRLNTTMKTLSKTVGNLEASRSTVLDADIAAETSNLAKQTLQQQSAMFAMMSKRQNAAMVLQLLQ